MPGRKIRTFAGSPLEDHLIDHGVSPLVLRYLDHNYAAAVSYHERLHRDYEAAKAERFGTLSELEGERS